jgi:hypothetical protein
MADLVSGGGGSNGKLTLTTDDDQVAARLFTQGVTTTAAGTTGRRAGGRGRATTGAIAALGAAGTGAILDPHAVLNVPADTFEIGHQGRGGSVLLHGASNELSVRLAGGDTGAPAALALGSASHPGTLAIRSTNTGAAFAVTLPAGHVQLDIGEQGRIGVLRLLDDQGRQRVAVDATLGQIYLTNENGVHMVILDAQSGDIVLSNADVAEEFDVADDVEPGCVVRIGVDGRLERTHAPFDPRVAGVVSGSGNRPGLVLDRRTTGSRRLPVAMLGKVTCLADATRRPIRAGALLTSSATAGHAMAVDDPREAVGAIIGKALGDLSAGYGQIPMIVGLH